MASLSSSKLLLIIVLAVILFLLILWLINPRIHVNPPPKPLPAESNALIGFYLFFSLL